MDWQKNTYLDLYKKLTKKEDFTDPFSRSSSKSYLIDTQIKKEGRPYFIAVANVILCVFLILFLSIFLTFFHSYLLQQCSLAWRLIALLPVFYYYMMFYNAIQRLKYTLTSLPPVRHILETGAGLLLHTCLLLIGFSSLVTIYHYYKNPMDITLTFFITLLFYVFALWKLIPRLITHILDNIIEPLLLHVNLQSNESEDVNSSSFVESETIKTSPFVQPNPIVTTPPLSASDITLNIFHGLYIAFMTLINTFFLGIISIGAAIFIYLTYQDQTFLIHFLDQTAVIPWLQQIKLATLSDGSLTIDWERLRLYVGAIALTLFLLIFFGLSSLWSNRSTSNNESYPPDETTHP